MKNSFINLSNEKKTIQLGYEISLLCKKKIPIVIYLCGELGTGKTTFAKGFLNGLGYKGTVKSPTYNIVECYHLPNLIVNHFDFYRLSNEQDLELIGIRDFFCKNCLSLIEWPEKFLFSLPSPDLILNIKYKKKNLRLAKISFISSKSIIILKSFNYLKKNY